MSVVPVANKSKQPEQCPDDFLVVRCQARDEHGFRELVRRWEPRLYYYLRRLLEEESAVWDVLQNTWLAVFRHLPRLEDARKFRSWVYRIAHDQAVNWLQKEKRYVCQPDEQIEPRVTSEDSACVPTEDVALLHQALLKLSPPHREVAVLSGAFYCFLRAGRVQDAANAAWWAVCSMHLLLWFLVFFLWHVHRLIHRIPSAAARVRPSRGEHRTVFFCALALCVFSTALLWKSALMQDGLKLVRVTCDILWGPVFFLFWHPFGIASAVARLWLKHRELELQTSSKAAARGSVPSGESS